MVLKLSNQETGEEGGPLPGFWLLLLLLSMVLALLVSITEPLPHFFANMQLSKPHGVTSSLRHLLQWRRQQRDFGERRGRPPHTKRRRKEGAYGQRRRRRRKRRRSAFASASKAASRLFSAPLQANAAAAAAAAAEAEALTTWAISTPYIQHTLSLSFSLSLATAFTLLNSALFLLPGTKKGEIFSSLSIKRIVLYRLCLPPIMPKSIVPLEAVGSTDSVTNREVTGGASSALRWEMGGGGGGWTGTTVGGTFWVGYMMMM